MPERLKAISARTMQHTSAAPLNKVCRPKKYGNRRKAGNLCSSMFPE